MLNEVAKARVRVHLGVPAAGIQQTGSTLGYRYNQTIGQLEYRMNNLQPIEEAQVTGSALAVIGLTGQPVVGNILTVTIGAGAAINYTVTASDVIAPLPLQSIASNAAAAITAANQGYLGNYGIPPASATTQQPFYNGTLLIAPATASSAPFALVASTTGVGLVAFIQQPGVPLPPIVTFGETNTTIYGYVPISDYLQSRIYLASDLVKYTKADVVNFRPNELAERRNIYAQARQDLADFMGIPLYPMGNPQRAGGGTFTGML